MTRKEKRAEAERKRQEWFNRILKQFHRALEATEFVDQAADLVDRWLSKEIEANPQSKTIIMDAAIRVRVLIEESVKVATARGMEKLKEQVGIAREVQGAKVRIDSVEETPGSVNIKSTVQPPVSAEHIQVNFKVGEMP